MRLWVERVPTHSMLCVSYQTSESCHRLSLYHVQSSYGHRPGYTSHHRSHRWLGTLFPLEVPLEVLVLLGVRLMT